MRVTRIIDEAPPAAASPRVRLPGRAALEQRISTADARRMLSSYDFSPRMTDQDVGNMEQNQTYMIENRMLTRRIDVRRDLVNDMAFAAG
jgi:sulfonate transport system substrate-binding protein